MTPLFLPEVDPHAFFEKQASIAKMPDDDTKWPAHVLSNLHQQLPFLSQYEVDLSLQRVEPEAGFAFGHALLMAKNDPAAATESKNPQNMIKIPVIIADRQLQPFHTFELGGNVYPLTSERIEAALLNPAVFEGPARQPHRQKSLIDQMYPPYQQRQGFGRTVGAGTSSMGVTKLSSAPQSSDAFSMDPERLRTIAKLRSRETEDRYQTQKGLGGRMKSNLKNLALPVGAGLAVAGVRGGLGAKKGGLKAMQAGAKKGVKQGLLTSGAVSAANIGLKERGLAKRQQQRAEIGMPRVGTLEDPQAVKAASVFKNPYVAMGTLGAGAMGTRSLMKNKNQMIQDMRDRRSGKINSEELKRRMKEYAGSAAIDAAVGGGLGIGGTAAVKKLAVPQIKNVAEQVGDFTDRKVRDAAREAMTEVDKTMDDKVYKINAAMAQRVDDIDQRVEKQVRNAVPNMAAGVRDAAAEQARQATGGIGARLKNMFRKREDKWRDIADAPPTGPVSAPPTGPVS